jgi:hypothetical protein
VIQHTHLNVDSQILSTESELLLPPFRNIRCFSFVKLMYLDIF